MSLRMKPYLLLLFTLFSLLCPAQVTRTTLFGVGGASVLDTYLSPYTYSGPSIAISMQTERTARWGKGHVTTMALYAAQGAMASSEVSGVQQWDGQLTLASGWHRNWLLADGHLRLAAGGLMELSGGGTYCTIGGNNPAQGRLAFDVAASGIAAYTFRVKKHHWQVRSQLDVPLLGTAFAPQYGQSYYELFHLGHYNHNVRPTYPLNAPSVRLQATLAIPVRKSQFIVGYGGDVRQSSLNGLKRHAWYNQFLIGFSRKLTLAQ